jgi:alpha-ketoglutarate-dependent taurine dioxygenase
MTMREIRLSPSGAFDNAAKDYAHIAVQPLAAAMEGQAHPLVRTHPHTGELSLYLDEVYATGIDGMTGPESRPLLEFLIAHITQHHFTCRLRWEVGMVVMWDNRTALHLAANDYDGHRRELYRTTLAGETPA